MKQCTRPEIKVSFIKENFTAEHVIRISDPENFKERMATARNCQGTNNQGRLLPKTNGDKPNYS
jgi:hypothetical protein